MIDRKLPQITIAQKKGAFTGADIELPLGKRLAVVPLVWEKGRQFYSTMYKGTLETPVCYSRDGIKSALPFDLNQRYGARALWRQCHDCPQNRASTKQARGCEPLWSVVALLADGTVARLLINQPSQRALFQYYARITSAITEAKQLVPSVELRSCDFALSLELEKRRGMTNFGLRYPAFQDSIIQIPFCDGRSKFDAEFERYDQQARKEAGGLTALENLIYQGREYAGGTDVGDSDDVIQELISEVVEI